MFNHPDQNTRVFAQLVALAGSPVVVYNVIDYLSATLTHTPTADEIADEIVRRRNRAVAAHAA